MGEPDPRAELAELVRRLSVVHGRVTLSSGKEADYYVDLRRATLHHRASALIGKLMRELTDDWDYAVVGGLTLGADPVATAIMHAPGRPIDAFVVRKSAKTHGLQRLIEGSEVSGQRVLVVEDDAELLDRLRDPDYPGKVERAIVFTVEAWDINCHQHIHQRFSQRQVQPVIGELQRRIAELEAELANLRSGHV